MPLTSKFPRERYVRQGLLLALSVLGLAWGIWTFPQSETADDSWDLESHLLGFEHFDKSALTQIIADPASSTLSGCETHFQRAMLLAEMPLAEAALRSGETAEFDRRVQSLENRSRRVLACTPRQSFVWLVAFNLEVLHGLPTGRAFDLLDMSYQTSPNEAWISLRRINVAMPLLLMAPVPLQQKILTEFKQLARFGFLNEAVRIYLGASKPIRERLQTRVEQLAPNLQKAFSDALQRFSPTQAASPPNGCCG